MDIWVNIDLPTKTYRIFNERKSPKTLYSKEEESKRFGGWLGFSSYEEAIHLYRVDYSHFVLIDRRISVLASLSS